MSYLDAINLAMKEEMERDERVFILGEDVVLFALRVVMDLLVVVVL